MRKSKHSKTDKTTVPVIREEAEVSTHEVESGRVRIDKTVEEEEIHLTENLLQQRVRLEHVPFGIEVDPDHIPEIRYEADVTIVPVMEEVLVCEKRLLLKEEIHIYLETEEQPSDIPVMLKSEKVTVSRS